MLAMQLAVWASAFWVRIANHGSIDLEFHFYKGSVSRNNKIFKTNSQLHVA